MNNNRRVVAERFRAYSHLGWLGRWRFRQGLRRISRDTASLECLIALQRTFEIEWLSDKEIHRILWTCLGWYNREAEGNRHVKNPIRSDRLPEMMQILAFFLRRFNKFRYSYRPLLQSILSFGDRLAENRGPGFGVTPQQFRLEAAAVFSALILRREIIEHYQERHGDRLLGSLENIADKTGNLELFKLFCLEAEKITWGFAKEYGYLESIADKVKDFPGFEMVFRKAIPVIGLAATSSVLAISRNAQDFEVYSRRIIAQLDSLPPGGNSVFTQPMNASELNRLLAFLEALADNSRTRRYFQFTQAHFPGKLSGYVSSAFNTLKSYVHDACLKQEWKESSEHGPAIEGLVDKFEQAIVRAYLNSIWGSTYGRGNIRWEVDKFTEYIPYEMRTRDWREDSDKNRSYWNSGEAAGRELRRYIDALEPQLFPILRKMEPPAVEVLFSRLATCLGIQTYTKQVMVPVEWEKGVEFQEGYDKWAGNYGRDVEVARPKRFVEHTFTFERPYLQDAIELLNSMDTNP